MNPKLLSSEEDISLKSLSLDSRGRMSKRRSIGPLAFAFEHDGALWRCKFVERGGRAGLTVETHAARLPAGPAFRRAARHSQALAAQEDVTVILHRDGVVTLQIRRSPQAPVTAEKMVTELAQTALQAAPWRRLLRQLTDGG